MRYDLASTSFLPLINSDTNVACITPQPIFKLPISAWTKQIGNTPLVQLEPGLHVKLEGYNPSGSYKDRALTSIFVNHFDNGALRESGSTLCIVTSGSAGRSLAMLHESVSKATASQNFDLDLNIVIPLAYANKSNPLSIIKLGGVNTFFEGYGQYFHHVTNNKLEIRQRHGRRKGGSINVIFDDQDFKQTVARAKLIASKNNWVMADQHYDCSGMHAHGSMARELMAQLPQLTDGEYTEHQLKRLLWSCQFY